MKLLGVQADTAGPHRYVFESENVLALYSWSRLMVLSLVYVGSIVVQLTHGDFLCTEVWQPIHVLASIAFALHFALLEWATNVKRVQLVITGLFAFDIFAVIVVMNNFSIWQPLFIFSLLIILIAAAFILGSRATLKLAAWCAALLNLSLAVNPDFNSAASHTSLMAQNLAFFLVAGLGGVLGDQLQSASADLAEKREEIQNLSDINQVIVENVPSGLLALDREFKVIFANRGAAKIFSDLSLEGKDLKEFFSDLHAVVEQFSSNEARTRKNAVSRHEIDFLNYKKEKLILEVIITAAHRTGELAHFLCLVQNLTEIKSLEMAMRQKEKLAAVGQLAAGIAHEIRNPLASISGSVQLLQAGLQVQSAEDKKLLAIMVKEIDRLNRLVSEFLDYVRPDVRADDPILINTLIREVIEVAKLNETLSKKIEHRSELKSQNIVYGHYDKLKQALLNIVINAYQAMADTLRPELYLQSYDSENKVVLVIHDNGIGMTKETQQRIFEPFHTTKPKGTGLGLAITHKILETHDAEIHIESELGKGTKMTLVFYTTDTRKDNNVAMKRYA